MCRVVGQYCRDHSAVRIIVISSPVQRPGARRIRLRNPLDLADRRAGAGIVFGIDHRFGRGSIAGLHFDRASQSVDRGLYPVSVGGCGRRIGGIGKRSGGAVGRSGLRRTRVAVVAIAKLAKRSAGGVRPCDVGKLLKGVTADQAARRPVAGGHTIWELVNHIAAWEGIATRRLRGEAWAPQDWPPMPEVADAAWVQALEHLDRTHRELEKRVRVLPEERLTGLVTGHKYSVYVMLHGVVQHNLYHAGQIALLKKA
jgi:uncharacterized damage-inducible protein DinB